MPLNIKIVVAGMLGKTGGLLDKDDLAQEARIAIWLAEKSGKVPADELHAVMFLRRVAKFAMIDAARRMHGGRGGDYRLIIGVDEVPDAAHEQNTERQAQAKQAAARLFRVAPTKHAQAFAMLRQGERETDVAAALGVSQARVTQYKRDAREWLKKSWP